MYAVATIAAYLGKRPQEVAKMIERDGLPAVGIPSDRKVVMKITLHGLHKWLKERAVGGKFMTVEELKQELEMTTGERNAA